MISSSLGLPYAKNERDARMRGLDARISVSYMCKRPDGSLYSSIFDLWTDSRISAFRLVDLWNRQAVGVLEASGYAHQYVALATPSWMERAKIAAHDAKR
jgi:hypothetical protein